MLYTNRNQNVGIKPEIKKKKDKTCTRRHFIHLQSVARDRLGQSDHHRHHQSKPSVCMYRVSYEQFEIKIIWFRCQRRMLKRRVNFEKRKPYLFKSIQNVIFVHSKSDRNSISSVFHNSGRW